MPVGCGSHEAVIVDRGGAVVARADTLLQVEWNRVLDDASTARILVQPDGDCCAAMANVRSWRHSLHIYRNRKPVWSGPIISPLWTLDGIDIQAIDPLGWLDRRVPHEDRTWTGTELTIIAQWLIEDGFAPDDPGHSVEIIGSTGIRGDRAYLKDVGQTGDHLQDLAKTGLDYTAIGSRILLLPEQFCSRVGSLTDEDFPDGLQVAEDGASLATRSVFDGAEGQGGAPSVRGEWGGVDPYYGLLERYNSETSILDDVSATAAARSQVRANSPAPTFIDTSQQTTLAPDAAVDVPSLVPGWCLDVTTTKTCRTISQSLKIHGVKVTADGSGERVSVQLVPSGV